MRRIFFMLTLWMTMPASAAAPLFHVKDPASDQNFKELADRIATHRHDNDGSSRFQSLYPDADSTYDLGTPGLEWANAYFDIFYVGEGNTVSQKTRMATDAASASFRVISPGAIFLQSGGGSSGKFQIGGSTETGTQLFLGDNGRLHIQPVGTADVELEVSNGVTQGGGTVHAASFTNHSSRTLKMDIAYFGPLEYQQAYKDVLALRHCRFRYKTPDGSPDPGGVHRGLIFEDSPKSLQGQHMDISLNDRITNLEMALQVLAAKVQALATEHQRLTQDLKRLK